eukprot:scaffold3142_cov416-Prasinococcus_capsulatus_cf.AAC.11
MAPGARAPGAPERDRGFQIESYKWARTGRRCTQFKRGWETRCHLCGARLLGSREEHDCALHCLVAAARSADCPYRSGSSMGVDDAGPVATVDPVVFMNTLSNDHPAVAALCTQLADLYQRKLWHQITTKLEEVVNSPEFQGELLIKLYQNFVEDFDLKLNKLKLVQFAVLVSRQYSDPAEAEKFLEKVVAKLAATKAVNVNEPILFGRMQIALLKLQTKDLDLCRDLVEAGAKELDGLLDVDPAVHAALYWVTCQLHKAKGEFAEFYRSALMYLSFISVEKDLDESSRLSLAVDLGLAALLGENVYGFGELLQHPIINVLEKGEQQYGWLFHILVAFQKGDLAAYDELCVKFADQLNAQPALVANEAQLREKVTIMCLLDLIFCLPSGERNISLTTIAERTRLSTEEVEFLLMKTLCSGLIKGEIDQVAGTVTITWVQPRVLDLAQVQELNERMASCHLTHERVARATFAMTRTPDQTDHRMARPGRRYSSSAGILRNISSVSSFSGRSTFKASITTLVHPSMPGFSG